MSIILKDDVVSHCVCLSVSLSVIFCIVSIQTFVSKTLYKNHVHVVLARELVGAIHVGAV